MRRTLVAGALLAVFAGGLLASCGGSGGDLSGLFSGIASGASTDPIPLPDAAFPGSEYPSTITVTTPHTSISSFLFILRLTHSRPRDVDLLLLGPTGVTVQIMGDCLQSSPLANDLFYITHDSVTDLPDTTLAPPIPPGPYRATDYDPGGDTDLFGVTAPPAPYGISLGAYLGTDPNGDWHLFAVDDEVGGAGVNQVDAWGLWLGVGP